MLSNKNVQERLKKEETKKQRFSIRKFTVGAASVLIGVTFMGMSNQTVNADAGVTNRPGVTGINGGSTDATGNKSADDIALSGKDKEKWENKGTSVNYKDIKNKVNELKPKVDASTDDQAASQTKNDHKANTTKSSTENTDFTKNKSQAKKNETYSQKYTDDQLASLSPNDQHINEWKNIVDSYKPNDKNKNNWAKAYDEFNNAWNTWKKSKTEQKDWNTQYVKSLEDSMDALVKSMDQETKAQLQTKWSEVKKQGNSLTPTDLQGWKDLVDNNQALDHDAKTDLNAAWQKWLDDNTKSVASFNELKAKIDSLTKLMSENKDISQDPVADLKDSWGKDKTRLDDHSNADRDDYLASLSSKDLIDYKKALDDYAKLNSDSDWRTKYDDFITAWNNWDQSTKAWSTDRENKRKDFQEKVVPKLDDLINSMDQTDKFNDDYENKYQTNWNAVKDELSKHDTNQISVSVLKQIDLWKDSVDKYNNYLKQSSKNNAAWDDKYSTLNKAWQDWSKETQEWQIKRDSNKQKFVELEDKLADLIGSMQSLQPSERFDGAWQKTSEKLSKATADQVVNLSVEGMQVWKDQLAEYNKLVDLNDATWRVAYAEFIKAWDNWIGTKTNDSQEVQSKFGELVSKIASQNYYQKSWSELKTKLDSANDTQLLSLTPVQLQSWKALIENYNKSGNHVADWEKEYTSFETAWKNWAKAEKPNKDVANAFRTMFDKYVDLVNLLPDAEGKQNSTIKSVADLRDYFDANALLRAANLFHLFGRNVVLSTDTNGNIATQLLTDKVDFGARGESFNHTGGDVYYIENTDQLMGNGFRNPNGNYIIFGSGIKLEITNGVVYANGIKLDHVKPNQVVKIDNFINILDELDKLSKKSKELMNQKTSENVTVDFTDNNNEVIDVSRASSKNGFVYANVNGSDLNKGGTFKIKGLYKENSPALIINVIGSDIQFSPNMTIEGSDGNSFGSGEDHKYPNKVLWNFVDAKNISINSNLMGSVLAPHANFMARTNVDGNIIADTINVTGGETHRWDLHAFYGKNPDDDSKRNPTTGSGSTGNKSIQVPDLPKPVNGKVEVSEVPKNLVLPSFNPGTPLAVSVPLFLFSKKIQVQVPEFSPFVLAVTAPQPEVPDKSDKPDNPGSPDKPDKPGNPDKPDKPDKPDTPGNPDKPDKSNTPPTKPEVPAQPITPEIPQQPTASVIPQQPETPVPVSDFGAKFEKPQAKALEPKTAKKLKNTVHKNRNYKHIYALTSYGKVNNHNKYVKHVKYEKYAATSPQIKKVVNELPQTGEQSHNKAGIFGLALAGLGLLLGLISDKKRGKEN